jgi:hypothetical protein
MNIIAGPYSATYNAKALGNTQQGFTLSHEFFKQLITADATGDAPVDAIYRGRAQFCEFELIEATSAGVADLIDPYADVLGTPLTMGTIGKFDVGWASGAGCTGLTKSLVLTKISGSCATPTTVTLPLSILAEGYPVRLLHGTGLRSVPIRLRIYPSAAGVFGTQA